MNSKEMETFKRLMDPIVRPIPDEDMVAYSLIDAKTLMGDGGASFALVYQSDGYQASIGVAAHQTTPGRTDIYLQYKYDFTSKSDPIMMSIRAQDDELENAQEIASEALYSLILAGSERVSERSKKYGPDKLEITRNDTGGNHDLREEVGKHWGLQVV